MDVRITGVATFVTDEREGMYILTEVACEHRKGSVKLVWLAADLSLPTCLVARGQATVTKHGPPRAN